MQSSPDSATGRARGDATFVASLGSQSKNTSHGLSPFQTKSFLPFAVAPPGIPAEKFVGRRNDAHLQAAGEPAEEAACAARMEVAGHQQIAVRPQPPQFGKDDLCLLPSGSAVMRKL